MKEIVCNYAAVRFLPYRETDEFVNVGVVVYCPQIDYFDFRLETKRRKRIRNFFPELDINVLRSGLNEFARELKKRRTPVAKHLFTTPLTPEQVQNGLAQFRELIRRRESLLHFGEPGTLLVTDAQTALDEVYDRFVERRFAQSKDYQEGVMRQRLTSFLKEWKLRNAYKTNMEIGDDDFHVRMPFVHFEEAKAEKVIKPLDLCRTETTEVYDHGETWVGRLRRLQARQHLPEHVVFAVQFPPEGRQLHAANEVCDELRNLKVDVVAFDNTERLHELVKV